METNNNRRARVAVLMATHNDGPLLERAISSLISSEYPIDIFVVDDASSPPAGIPDDMSANCTLIRLDKNVGLTNALNTGLKHILQGGYEFVARMDADDWSFPSRFAKQVAFLEANPDLSGVGTWAEYFDAVTGEAMFVCKTPSNPDEIKIALYDNNPLLHPTWMLRSEVYRQLDGYDPSFPVAQDYDFVARATLLNHRFSNIPEVLLRYQITPNGISVSRRKSQLKARMRVQLRLLQWNSMASLIGFLKTAVLFAIPSAIVTQVKSLTRRPASK